MVCDSECTLSPEDGAVLEENPGRVSFPNCVLKRSKYCASKLEASLWSCIWEITSGSFSHVSTAMCPLL